MTRNQLLTGVAGLALALGVATTGEAREVPALADLEGRTDEVPLVFLGRVTIATGTQGAEEVDAMEKESFRYSGIGTLER